MSETTISTDLLSVERAGHSRLGNPTWRLHTTSGVYLTGTDASVGYDIANYDGRALREGLRVVLTLTRRGRIVGIERGAGA